MVETQLSLFDAQYAYTYKRKQQLADMEEQVLKMIGPKAFKKWKARHDREETLFAPYAAQDAINDFLIQSNPRILEDETLYKEHLKKTTSLRPDMIEAICKMNKEIMASVKPFLAEEYAMLGLAVGASKREIKNAYRRQARKLHPDKGGNEEAMKALNGAYKRLLAAAKE
jgi:DnaJ-domain-containing protein 1